MPQRKNPRLLAAFIAAGLSATVLLPLVAAQPFNPSGNQPKREKPAEPTTPKVGEMAPEWAVKDAKGKEHKLADYRGKIVVMDFWATWCGPCKAVMPGLQKLHDEYKDQGVVILGMNCWERGDPVKFMTDNKYTYGLLMNTDDVAKAYGVTGIPTFYVVGPDGKVLLHAVGSGEANKKKLEDTIKANLDKVKKDDQKKPDAKQPPAKDADKPPTGTNPTTPPPGKR